MDLHFERLYRAVLIVCIVLVVVFTSFFISLLRQQRRHRRLYQKSLSTEITTLEKERSRMAADLHDEVAPLLAAAKLKLGSFDESRSLDEVNNLIDRVLTRMREIAFNLMPGSLLRKGIGAAVMELVDAGKTAGLQIFIHEEKVALTEAQKIHLFRILQEIIHNTLKHAGATELRISIGAEDSQLMIKTTDNGRGFDHADALKTTLGMGLQNMLNRVEMLNGKFFVETGKGGSVYRFEIPLRS